MRRAREKGRVRADERGFAMIAVLLVLMALFVLCAPFLLSVTNADRASTQAADRAAARVGVETALRHARANLGSSHIGVDTTPYFDSIDELAVRMDFDEDFLDPADETGVMFGLDVEDLAGRIDLNSASPFVLANLLGGVARLTVDIEDVDTELEVNSTVGFADAGFVWIDRELIGYTSRDATKLMGLARGLGTREDADGNPTTCGPSPAMAHSLGDFVLDQRVYAIPRWRIQTGEEGELARFDAIEQVTRAAQNAMIEELPEDTLQVLARTTTTYGDIGAGSTWMRPARMTGTVRGQPDHGCFLELSDTRNFNNGTTVMITDGRVTEFGIVRSSNRDRIGLKEELQNEYEPFRALVYPMARRPVNVNTASPEVLRALVLNLNLRGESARITSSEADELVSVMVQSRPFEGFRDFVERIVLPCAGLEELPKDAPITPEIFGALRETGELQEDGSRRLVGFLDLEDAQALYKNALNANDNELHFSTMPFSFTSRDVYRMDLRASVNAKSGVERARRRREEVTSVIPQKDVLRVWARQEDFDEEPRLDREGAGWLSGPETTGRFDRVYESPWPTRAHANLGPYDTRKYDDPNADPSVDQQLETKPPLVFASREDEAWLQLAPARIYDQGARRAGHVLHFDDETGDLEGRYLPDGTLEFDPSGSRVGWVRGEFVGPLSFDVWLKPRDLVDGSRYLDLGGAFNDSDRIELLLENGDLVLKVRDGAGDHPDTTFEEVAEVRYPIAGEGPGLPADTWTHVEIGVSGNRPDQMHMLVDGRWASKTPGLTRLTQSLSADDNFIPVESTDGFPDPCVIRIGDEVIECRVDQGGFRARFDVDGDYPYFGGRLARERHRDVNQAFGFNMGLERVAYPDHQEGSAVQLYGYSTAIVDSLPTSGGTLSGQLGPFAVARLIGAREKGRDLRDPVLLRDAAYPQLGLGIPGDSDADELVLGVCDPLRPMADVMAAFSDNGGYAAILSRRYRFRLFDGTIAEADNSGARFGGIEVVKYSGKTADGLVLAARGDQLTLTKVTGDDVAGRASFVTRWTIPGPGSSWGFNGDMTHQVMVIPISIQVSGASSLTAFRQPGVDSEFAQITHVGSDAGGTEWVRYDEIEGDHLVRSDSEALQVANEAAHGGALGFDPGSEDPLAPKPSGPGSGPGQPGGPSGPSSFRASAPEPAAPAVPTPSVASSASQTGGAYWNYQMGVAEVEVSNFPVTRAVATQFQFRGVMGTFSHTHGPGQPVLPVFKINDGGPSKGWPGRFDHISFLNGSSLGGAADPSFPGVVHRSYRPHEYAIYSYRDGAVDLPADPEEIPDPNVVVADTEGQSFAEAGYDTTSIYVALQEPNLVPMAAQTNADDAADVRTVPRMTMFPSGELPRTAFTTLIGGAFDGASTLVPSAVVDEIAFGADLYEGQWIVAEPPLSRTDRTLEVRGAIRRPGGDRAEATPLNGLPEDAGLLRIGDEIVCYDQYDAAEDRITIADGGRGLLGTDPQPHMPGEAIRFLENYPVTVLAGSVTAQSAALPIVSSEDFPPSGTVLIGRELIHYTRIWDDALQMPRASEEPGEMDEKGPGLYRGRYGTQPGAYAVGTPVIVFPFRYWDRFTQKADAPEQHYYQFDVDQPEAYWRSVFWTVEDAPYGGVRLGVLQRTDQSVPWDADPDKEPGLELLWNGRFDAGGNRIGTQSRRIEWRAFVEYEDGAFDPENGLSHAWKTTPRLTLFGTEFMGPSRVLRRIDR